MNENVLLHRRIFARRREKAIALLVGKPLDCALNFGHDLHKRTRESKTEECMSDVVVWFRGKKYAKEKTCGAMAVTGSVVVRPTTMVVTSLK